MAISDTIQSMYENVGEVYDTITNVSLPEHKNIENIPSTIRDSYLEIMNNGIDVVWDNWEKVVGEGTELTLSNTEQAPMKVLLKGNTYQDSTTGKQLIDTSKVIPFTPTSAGWYSIDGSILNNPTQITGNTITYELEANKNYTFTLYEKKNVNSVQLLRVANDNFVAMGTLNDIGSRTISYTANTNLYIRCSYTSLNVETSVKVMLEEGTTSSNYEPYTNGASPNPDYPQEVHVVSGDNTITVCGKNLFSEANKLAGYYYEGGLIKKNGGARNAIYYIKCKSNTAYFLSFSAYQNISFIQIATSSLFPSDSVSVTNIGLVTLENLKRENFVTANDAQFIIIRVNVASGYDISNNPLSNFLNNFQIEANDQATTYTTYTSQSYHITLPEGMFMGWIGNYQDYIYKQDKKWYKYGAIGKVVLNGTETWSYNQNGFYQVNYSLAKSGNTAYSNYYIFYSNVTTADKYGFQFTSNYLRIKNTDQATANDLKTWLGTHNTTVYYVLATPTITEITDPTLISQLEALNGAKSYTGQTNINQNNNDMASVLNATALSNGTVTPSLQGIQTLSLGQNVDLQTQEPIEEQAEEVEEQGEEL